MQKIDRGMNILQTGCTLVLVNLFLGGFCLWGLYAGWVSWRLETTGESAQGTVVRMLEQDDSEGGCCVYVPVVEFSANGSRYTLEGDTASDPPQYEVGETVPVLYDPADPDTAQIDKWLERWLMPVILVPAMLLAAALVNFVTLRGWLRGRNDGHE
jgi:hypothetical protein